MGKSKMTKKAFVLSLAMLATSPIGAFAQKGLFQRDVAQGSLFQRGVFGKSYYDYDGANENPEFLIYHNLQTSGTIDNQTFGQSVPLGSGVLVLLAAGAGYAALKRKEDEK